MTEEEEIAEIFEEAQKVYEYGYSELVNID